LWAGDWATGKIWQLVKNGKTLKVPRLVADGLKFPEGMAVTPDEKSLIVVETGAGRLSRIKLSEGSVTPILSGLEVGFQGPATMPPTYVFNGVSVSPSGSIYVGADKTGFLYRIDTHP
jgi:sugar lactone lactonase YvrE